MKNTYKHFWTCKSCKQENSMNRSKHQAAFEHSPNFPPCKKCGGSDCSSSGFTLPSIDLELLETWYADPKLYFLEQDEDLIIADTDLDILKSFLQAGSDPKARALTLGPILAIKLYDDQFKASEERQWCIDWLRKNRNFWTKATAGYVKKKINPVLK